jgi:hypothetical protein
MNCTGFANIVNDLARAQMIDAALRERGLAHAGVCERCAARLADERALTAGLKSLAAGDEGKAAPDNLEAVLLEAFRAQTTTPVTQPSLAGSRNWPRWALAAAAAVLIAFGFIIYRSVQSAPRKSDVVIGGETPTPQPSIGREDQPLEIEQQVVDRQPRREPRSTQLAAHRRTNRSQTHRLFIRDSITAYANDSEYTTDFFPLDYGEAQTPMESGELIRVQMPRSALVRFGLPVNVERADVPVKADLLVGEDGLARAIRFVSNHQYQYRDQ